MSSVGIGFIKYVALGKHMWGMAYRCHYVFELYLERLKIYMKRYYTKYSDVSYFLVIV